VKTITVRLPEPLAAGIEAEARARRCSRSDVVRERLGLTRKGLGSQSSTLSAIADLIGSVDGLPSDLSEKKQHYLKTTGYGQKRSR
jgi:Arc/MetJ-type ribon-helix-helix transcriptional regulator